MAAVDAGQVAWWREPTKDQWYAWWAAWLGWTLDAFDFTVFLLIMKPIADEFGVLPALSVFYVRKFVKEPEIWLENRRQQRTQQREVHAPLVSIFKPGMLANTLLACWWMASNFVLYYSLTSLFATHLQQDLNMS